MNVVWLSIVWISWCAMHSILIDTSFIGLIKGHAAGLIRYYRVFYNGLSLATFVPLLLVTKMAAGNVIISWQGYAVWVRILFLAAAILLFAGGAGRYDLLYFLGIKQLRTGEEHLLLSRTEEFVETGVFGITRHPWYLGSLLFVWSMSSQYRLPVFIAVCIMSIYLVIGTILEERKIVARYGDRYRMYRQRVSMLFPWKWLVRLVRDHNQRRKN